ncbi:B3 domain-containing protein REM14-like [Solanum lycopersicum]|uniref:B3 domain-containing protein REM14-like n=1 Tax=Solanum lycopersicum TaxID=4081 RepID=UPI00374A1AC0
MKVASKKPRFFKPIQPGYKHCIKIPIGFLKYLKGLNHIKQAILRSRGKKWLVKVTGWRLEEGWKKFAKENDLQLGDLLIFKHEGDMEFEVSIFDSSHCDREYAEYLQEEEGNYVDATSKKVEKDLRHKTSDMTTPISQTPASTSADADPHFISTIRRYTFTKAILYFPMRFVKSNGLMSRSEMILVDEKQRSWSVLLGQMEHHFGIKRGWPQFRKANGLQEGDTYKFELTNNGTIPIIHMKEIELCALFGVALDLCWNTDVPTQKIPIGFLKFLNGHDQYEHAILGRAGKTWLVKKIPIDFLKYLEGMNHIKHAILKSMGKKWLVKVNGWRLEEGWEKFAEEHDLHLGDFLVFKHEGDMEFEVSIFDSSHCDREYTEYLLEGVDNAEETFKKVKFKEAATHNCRGQSHYQCIVRPNYISNGYLRLPKHFAIANGLTNKKCDLIVRDERQRSWNLRLVAYDSCVRVYGEWSNFCIVNNLKKGDYVTFEIVPYGEKICTIKHLRHKKSDVTTPMSQTLASTSADTNPHFISTIKPYAFTKALLVRYLPMDFVKSNGLMSRSEMILIDEKQRSWSVWLGQTGHQFGIKRGWTQFRNANGIQLGDTYKFELTNNGTIPIAHVNILEVKGCE